MRRYSRVLRQPRRIDRAAIVEAPPSGKLCAGHISRGVERHGHGGLWPRERKTAGKIIVLRAGGAKQDVGNALPFTSRQPRRNEGIRRIDLGVYPERPAREENHNGWHAFGMQAP